MKIFENKIIKRLFLIIGIMLLTGFTVLIITFYATLNFDEQITEYLTEDVIVINDFVVSIYLVKSDSGYILVDTGLFESYIEKALKYNHIPIDSVKHILITHSDIDHVNLIKYFKNAKVYFPAQEKKMLESKKQRFTFLPFYSNGFYINRFNLVSNGDGLNLAGKSIKCISLPGHTEGSMGYIFDGKYLFTGDAFRIKNGKITVPHLKWVLMDLEMMKRSLKKVTQLKDIKYIFTSHSGFTSNFNFAVSESK